jgi:hypothetical protein
MGLGQGKSQFNEGFRVAEFSRDQHWDMKTFFELMIRQRLLAGER